METIMEVTTMEIQMAVTQMAVTTMATSTLALAGLSADTVGPTVVVPIGVGIVTAKHKGIRIVRLSVTAWVEVTGTVYPLHLPEV